MSWKLKSLSVSTNFWIVVGALTILFISYYFYLNHYIKSKEQSIISTQFRVLDQIGDNIDSKLISLQSNANQLGSNIQFVEDQNENNDKKNSKTLTEQKNSIIEKSIVKKDFSTIGSYLNKNLEVYGFRIDSGDTFSFKTNEGESNILSKLDPDTYYYFKAVSLDTVEAFGDKDSVYVRTKYINLVPGLLRKDVFDDMFIVYDTSIIFSTLNSDLFLGISEETDDLVSNSKGKEREEEIIQNDRLLLPSDNDPVTGYLYSGEFSEITISNKKYKLFLKPVKVGDQRWYLCGLMETSNFKAMSKSISPWVIILLSLLLILILLGLPLIKLKVISKIEHLNTSIITNSALSILFGSSVITLFFLFASQNSVKLHNTDNYLLKFNNSVYSTLNKEINNAINQLTYFDSIHSSFEFNDEAKYPVRPVVADILRYDSTKTASPKHYPFVDFLFWINEKGTQSAYLTTLKEDGPLSNLKHRDYFKYKDEWFLPGDSTKKFRMESILSLASGNHKVGMSTTSNTSENEVIALSSKFYSLIDPIIPKDYGFCIIDETGKVWFHSNKNRNMMENFISECNESEYLKSAIYNRTSKPVYVDYYNKPHRAYIRPIDKLPLFLVTFHNRKAETSFHAQVFTLTLIMLSIFFLFIFIQVIVLLIMENRLKWKLSKNLIMKITRPMIHLSSHYMYLLKVYVIVAIVTAIMLSFTNSLQSVILVFSLEIILFTFSYRVLNHNEVKEKHRKRFTIINFIVLAILNIGIITKLERLDWLGIISFQILLVIFLEISYVIFEKRHKNHSIYFNSSFIRDYVLFLIALTFLFSILPTLKFYEIAYNTESELRLRHNQVDLMKKREKRNTYWNNYYSNQINRSDYATKVFNNRKDKGVYVNFVNRLQFSDDAIPSVTRENYPDKHSIFDSLVVFFRPYYDEDIVENKYLAYGAKKDSKINWYKYGNDSLVMKYLTATETTDFKTLSYNRVVGHVNKLNFLLPFHGISFTGGKGIIANIIFWTLIIFILYILYYLVRFGIRNIYNVDIIQSYSRESFGEKIRQQMLANKDIFVVRLSAKDETMAIIHDMFKDIYLDWSREEIINSSLEIIKKGIDNKKQSNTIIDIIDSEKGKNEILNETTTVLIENFDWRYDNPEIFKQKLGVLWNLVNRNDVRLIMLSQVHPNIIIDYYQNIIKNSSNSYEKETLKDMNIAQYVNNLTEFKRLAAITIVNYLPLRYDFSWKDEESFCYREKKKMTYTELIDSELHASDYLLQFENSLHEYYETYCAERKMEYPEEMIISKIVSLADSYYEDVFNSCSDEEKYVLYDLAEDLIMNQKNAKAINGLLEKGILIKKCDRIRLMNISFRKYVISRLSKKDTSALEIKIGKETGTWQGYRFTMILIISGLFVFIAMANQDFLDNLNQLFIVVGGGIAAITGILGLLSRTKSNES